MKNQGEIRQILKGRIVNNNGILSEASNLGEAMLFGKVNGSDFAKFFGVYYLKQYYTASSNLKDAYEKAKTVLYTLGLPLMLREFPQSFCCFRFRMLGNAAILILSQEGKRLLLEVHTAKTPFSKNVCKKTLKLFEKNMEGLIKLSGEVIKDETFYLKIKNLKKERAKQKALNLAEKEKKNIEKEAKKKIKSASFGEDKVALLRAEADRLEAEIKEKERKEAEKAAIIENESKRLEALKEKLRLQENSPEIIAFNEKEKQAVKAAAQNAADENVQKQLQKLDAVADIVKTVSENIEENNRIEQEKTDEDKAFFEEIAKEMKNNR